MNQKNQDESVKLRSKNYSKRKLTNSMYEETLLRGIFGLKKFNKLI